jgi:hypothetical protein
VCYQLVCLFHHPHAEYFYYRRIIAQRDSLHSSFVADFQGDAVTQFVNNLPVYDRAYDRAKYYGRTIAIAQSSGTGKSKLMHDLSKTVIYVLCY